MNQTKQFDVESAGPEPSTPRPQKKVTLKDLLVSYQQNEMQLEATLQTIRDIRDKQGNIVVQLANNINDLHPKPNRAERRREAKKVKVTKK